MTAAVYSLPDAAPLFPKPPYYYRNYRKLSVFCRTDSAALARMLPRHLTAVSDVMEVFVMDVPDGGPLGAYREGGIVVPVECGGQRGGHVLYEFVTNDDSMAAGREIWGYPKKMSKVDWSEHEGRVRGRVVRRGEILIDADFRPDANVSFDKPPLQPRYQVKRFPAVNGEGFDMDRVIVNELQDATVHQRVVGSATVSLGGNPQDPLHELPVLKVLGAEFIVADFTLTFGRFLD
ncbi:acetoacetate decarboxylase family protein [Paraburkholderia bonniea]|uniref:acetoacetate decarboxylase family protein n=1 Tax=Paraburkholderia bonniea TaxID=2152891 RepID=UPI001290CF07|nr:acetoacetate decarboxylase family protein [Paraburkholderia bonniea]WJF89631.1 acetoacetate decarboxylase family protein [Paraburkholderia bonniea]WJF92945.1 acetoacetate decarboxylase family protein [Paraburkholderia bonniea]